MIDYFRKKVIYQMRFRWWTEKWLSIKSLIQLSLTRHAVNKNVQVQMAVVDDVS